jgi:hypothetical protein
MTLSIRTYLVTDREPLIALWERCLLTRPWNDPSADIDLAIRADSAEIFIGLHGDHLIASVMVGFDGHRGWVYYLAVDPSYRKNGHGRKLMAIAEAWLVERHAPKIQLMVRGDNETAIGFYAALGYTEQNVKTIGKRLDTGE